MKTEINIFIAGVGGQGVIMISELLGEAAVRQGISVRSSDVLGMAVRGGPVISTIRLGGETYAALIPMGKCDIMLGMEPGECLRNIGYLSQSSIVILNTRKILPVMVLIGKSNYPSLEQIVEILKANSGKVVALDIFKLATEVGNPRSANIVMLGAAFGTGLIPIKIETIKETIESRFPNPKVAQVNIEAFNLGYKAYQEATS